MRGVGVGIAPCGLRHVALDAPPAAIEVGPGERAVYAVHWLGGRPVGASLLSAAELPVPAPAVVALAADAAAKALAQDGPSTAPVTAPPGAVSVIVCTRDRATDLRRCLASLLRCDPAPAEIVVVDNASASEAAERIAAEAGAPVRFVREPTPGLSHARNAGVRAARGPILAFTDDDVEVPVDWIARIAAPFADPSVVCATGFVIPADLHSDAACLFEFEVGGFGRELVRRRFDANYLRRGWWRSPEVWKIGAGANMAIRRAAFVAVGLFDPRLGAGAAGCSEDSEFWFRLLRAGLVCTYDPAAVVYHHHRGDRPALARQLRAYARGHSVALFVQFAQDRRVCHLVRALWTAPVYHLRRALRALARGDRVRLTLVSHELRGCVEGPIAALRWMRLPGPAPLAPQGAET